MSCDAVWAHLQLPVLELLLPKLKPGAVVITGNTFFARQGKILNLLRDVSGPFRSNVVSFNSQLEFSIYDP